MKNIYVVMVIMFMVRCQQSLGQPVIDTAYKKGKFLYKDDFDKDLKNWIIETQASKNSKVFIENQKLVMDVDGGATVWLNKRLSGNIMIEYKRKVIMNNGKNDRLSDLN